MAEVTAEPRLSDGQCTGFPDQVGPLDFRECCLAHDAGGSDGTLLDCLVSEAQEAGLGWVAPVLCLAIALMMMARPIYMWMQRKGWVK